MSEMGRLAPVALRSVWQHEAHDFTPWLLANAEDLGAALGMDLSLNRAEHPVGGYSLDLIGTDQATDDLVIIENQLETTDHTHLGQLLTYAAGTDAVNVVWLAAVFRPEHRAALDWLNQRTDVETRFFGVEVSAVRIGDSLPAPLFQVVAKPNDWGKQVRTRAQAEEGGASERSMRYAEFWGRFLETVHREEPSWTNARSAPAQNWFNLPTGTSEMVFNLGFGRRGLFSTLYLEHPDPDTNQARYEWLEARRSALEEAYGGALDYDEKPGAKAAAIGDVTHGDISLVGAWDDYIEWLIYSQRRFRHALEVVGGIPALANVISP